MASLQELITTLGFEVDTEGLEHLHHKIEGISEAVKVLAGIEIVKGLYELAERFAGLGESLESAAITAGITTEALQKLQFAASQNAVSSGELSGALSRMGRLLYQAQKGSKGATEAFKKLGIDKAQIDSFASTEDALYAIQDGMGNLTTQQEKLAVVQQLFGRAGGKFLKFLQVGSEGTIKLGDSAEQMGAVISGEGVKALAEFEDAASGLGQVMKGFLATVASKFAPGFIYAIHAVENAWSKNRQLISDALDYLGHKFAYVTTYISVVIEEMSKTVSAILYRHGGIGEWVSSVGRNIIGVIGTVVDSIVKIINQLSGEGTLGTVFESFKALATSLGDTLKVFAASLDVVLRGILGIGNTKTDRLEGITTALRGMAAVAKAVADTLTVVSQIVGSLFKGEIGDFWGQMLSPRAAKGFSFLTQETAADEDYRQQGTPAAAAAAMQRAAMENSAKYAAPPGGYTPQAQAAFGGPTINLTSNTTVNAPPGMTPEKTAELYQQMHTQSLDKILKEANRDTQTAWQY